MGLGRAGNACDPLRRVPFINRCSVPLSASHYRIGAIGIIAITSSTATTPMILSRRGRIRVNVNESRYLYWDVKTL